LYWLLWICVWPVTGDHSPLLHQQTKKKMDTNPSIGSIKNTNRTCTLNIRFAPGTDLEVHVNLEPLGELDLDPIAFTGPEVPMIIDVEVLLGTRRDPRLITLWYEVIDGMNQFIYTISPENKPSTPGGPKPLYAVAPTTPGKDVALGIDYFGDGVVIVGTGDL
jgi:hypothetical protein